MKVNSRELSRVMKDVDITKEDVIFSVSEKGIGEMYSVNQKTGVLVQSRFNVEDVDADKEYYIPKGISNSIAPLSTFSSNLDVSESKGKLKFSAGSMANINVRLLDEKPVEYKQEEPVIAFMFSGKEFLKAVSAACDTSDMLLSITINDDDTITCRGVSGNMVTRTEMSYRAGKMLCDDIQELESKYVTINGAKDGKEDNFETISFAINPDTWRTAASIFRDEWCMMFLSKEQLMFRWKDDRQMLFITLPLEFKGNKESLEALVDSVTSKKGIIETNINYDEFNNAINLVSVASKELKVSLLKDKLQLDSVSGSVKVNIGEVDAEYEDKRFNAEFIKKRLSIFKGCKCIRLGLSDDPFILMSTSMEYQYQDQRGEDIVQAVDCLTLILGCTDSE